MAAPLVEERDVLRERLKDQLEVTKQHAEEWVKADRQVAVLQREIERLGNELLDVKTRLRMAQDHEATDRKAVVDIVRERLGMDRGLKAKLDLLRQQLKQELAYIAYLEENLVDGTTPFNELSLEARRAYFERVEGQVR